MRKLNLDEIKAIELNILKQFDSFCQENNLTYYLAGGTLLGAIRHKGFIPWDDDIDVCMPRPDYEAFQKSFNGYGENLALRSLLLKNFDAPYCKIVDVNTFVDVKYLSALGEDKIGIDVFPVDGLPENVDEVKAIYKKAARYRLLLMTCSAKYGSGTTLFKKISKAIIKPLALIFGKKYWLKLLDGLSKQYNYQASQYVGIVGWGLYGPGERMLKHAFEQKILVDFEGFAFPAFSCWHEYLSGLYGDYMKLPPLEKRISHTRDCYLRTK